MSYHVGDNPSEVTQNRRSFFDALGLNESEVAIPEQCHGSTVRRAVRPGAYPTCDSLVTNEKRVFLSVSVADCVPVFLYDPEKEAVAAIHAGWRGCSNGIIEKTVDALMKEFHTRPENLIAYLGPSARSCCYEVGEDVARLFASEYVSPKDNGRFFLDLQSSTAAQLVDAGLRADQIEDCGLCTISSPESFHSYRRDGPRSGRMLGVIGIVA
jgi:YfiH family protein